MNVRRIQLETDYPVIREWWVRRGSEAPSMALLPDTSVISELDGVPVACAFLYEDKGGSIAIVEWEATNPDCHSAMTLLRGLNQVFDFFETYCSNRGIGTLLSWVKSGRGDGRLLERRKWVKCTGERHELMAFATQPQEALCQR